MSQLHAFKGAGAFSIFPDARDPDTLVGTFQHGFAGRRVVIWLLRGARCHVDRRCLVDVVAGTEKQSSSSSLISSESKKKEQFVEGNHCVSFVFSCVFFGSWMRRL